MACARPEYVEQPYNGLHRIRDLVHTILWPCTHREHIFKHTQIRGQHVAINLGKVGVSFGIQRCFI